MEFMEFIIDERLILIPILYFLGFVVKKTPKVQDWTIPYIIIVLGITLSIGLGGFGTHSVLQGILVAGVTVMANQTVKQTINK